MTEGNFPEEVLVDDEGHLGRYRAPALDKGLDILEVLALEAQGMTRAEIVKALGLGPSQIYRMLERLVMRGYVSRIGGDRYALSMKLFLLATRHPPLRRLVAAAQPLLDEFARDLQQSCHLVVPEQGAGVVVAQASPPGHWEFRAKLGGTLDLFNTASGLCLLAFQKPENLRENLALWGVEQAESQLAKAMPEIENIRRLGMRMAPSRQLVGVTDITVPIFGPADEPVAVITCAYIEHPEAPIAENRQNTLKALEQVAKRISLN